MPIINYAAGSDTADGFDFTTDKPYLQITSSGSVFGGESIAGGVATAYYGIHGAGGYFYIDNAGQVSSAKCGIELENGGDLINEHSGTVSDGVDMLYGTVSNFGTISAYDNHGSAIGFENTGASNVSHVTNNGTINGDVSFGIDSKSDNFFDGIGGTVNGGVFGGLGNDTFDLSHQAVTGTIDGGGGKDKVSFDSASGGMTVDLVQNSATGAGEQFTLREISDVVGSHYADTITGNGNDNVIAAGTGNDVVSGGAGNDTIDGGMGNDVLDGGAGIGDTVGYISAAGGVTVSLLLQGHAQNTGGSGTDTLTGFENISGSYHDDTLTGDGNANTIGGGYGSDIIDGGGGDDTLVGSLTSVVSYASATTGVTVSLAAEGSGQNTIGSGIDKLYGFEKLVGSSYADHLFGDGSANTIVGGNGNDVIFGDGGNDTLSGGGGSDRFLYTGASVASDTTDRIVDFQTGSDKIDLTAIGSINQITIGNSGTMTVVNVMVDNDFFFGQIEIDVNGLKAVKMSDILVAGKSAGPAHPAAANDVIVHYLTEDGASHAFVGEHGLYG